MDTTKVRKGLFQDDKLENELFDKGFINIPFLSDDELEELKGYYYGVHPNEKLELEGTMHGIHMTTWSGNDGYKRLVKSFLANVFEKGASRLFNNHRLLNHVFIVKEGGDTTEFNIHQDWSVVDESVDYSVNIWVPLHDVTKDNGALWILPGSHRLDQPIRGAGCLFPDYMSQMEVLKDKVRCIEVKAGEALIFFHATIHGSPPNQSTERRAVACATAIYEDAALTTYFQRSEDSELEVYNPADDFMFTYSDIMNDASVVAPKAKLIEKRPSYTLKKLDTDVLLDMAN